MKKSFGIILLLTITFTSVAQTNFRQGFIVTNEGDTLNGKVDYRGDKLMCKVCTFKSKELGKRSIMRVKLPRIILRMEEYLNR